MTTMQALIERLDVVANPRETAVVSAKMPLSEAASEPYVDLIRQFNDLVRQIKSAEAAYSELLSVAVATRDGEISSDSHVRVARDNVTKLMRRAVGMSERIFTIFRDNMEHYKKSLEDLR